MIAHISDLHLSSFGDTLVDRQYRVKRSALSVSFNARRHELCLEIEGWSIVRDRLFRKKVFLIDPEGYRHSVKQSSLDQDGLDPVEQAACIALQLESRRALTLAKELPSPAALDALLQETPRNVNLRFLSSLQQICAAKPDVILITGDLTDNGSGYELIEAAFAPWVPDMRLLAVRGNHDAYLLPVLGSDRPRPTRETKNKAWLNFAHRIGLDLDESGAWCVAYAEAGLIVVGLDSCTQPPPRFFRHNGSIGALQLDYIQQIARTVAWQKARHRLVAFHHHIVPLSKGIGKRHPPEMGMKLDDAPEVAKVLNEIGATIILHGHRHISEHRHPAGCHFQLLSSPSLTLGCKSGDTPSFWRLELGNHVQVSRVRLSHGERIPSEG
ncbi:hypothetical protein BCY86_03885 [Pajaroellobacter abortibovis]|uniref:Calcineurin-like phosphoesterase domain-containing protein n=1 Tax=Pajaroellobacter abortibovis TaxID=1882918 RepID=A0A1L6MWT0_9BACT|nr:hypothetical protein BCY86_03885 [Pajaroellobacter abortibovis]